MLSNKTLASLLLIFLTKILPITTNAGGDAPKTDNDIFKKTNIIIFIVDDLGYGDLGCFGNDTIKTPNIDKMAAEGATLVHNLAADSLCTPSRAALLTGRYPIRSGMACHGDLYPVILFSSSAGGLTQEETTIAKLAKTYGYSTGFFGKWHLGINCDTADDFCHHPMRHGFDTFYGFPMSNLADYGPEGGGLTGYTVVAYRKMNTWKSFLKTFLASLMVSWILLKKRLLSRKKIIILNLIISFPFLYMLWSFCNLKFINSVVMRDYVVVEQPIRFGNITQRLVNESVSFIEEKTRGDEPFLMVISWLQVHTYLSTSNKFKDHSVFGQYGDNVEEMDWGVGVVMETLERLKLTEDTFVYLTSDNGGMTSESGPGGGCQGGYNGVLRGAKGQSVMDGGVRVPAVAQWKNKIKPRTIINTPTSLMDVLPTLTESIFKKEASGTNSNKNEEEGRELYEGLILDGKNIESLLRGTSEHSPHRFIFHYCCQEIQAVRFIPDDNSSDVYKVYFATPKWLPGTQVCSSGICPCTEEFIIRHNPPLITNIGQDPSEKAGEIPEKDPKYAEILKLVYEAIDDHEKSLNQVGGRRESQMNYVDMLPRPWLQLCCNFPFFHCIEDKYRDF